MNIPRESQVSIFFFSSSCSSYLPKGDCDTELHKTHADSYFLTTYLHKWKLKQKPSPGKHSVPKTIFAFILICSLVTEWVTPALTTVINR